MSNYNCNYVIIVSKYCEKSFNMSKNSKNVKTVTEHIGYEVNTKEKIILHSLSAIIPFIILGIIFAMRDIHPFGNRQILIIDFWHQYFPFISDYWHKLRGGNSLLWSWTAGGGHDYLSHIAYYMASPLNFFVVLFPHNILREVLTVFVLIRVGIAGLFMSIFLRYSLRKYDMLLPAFSSLYALCAFVLGYYWNIMWLDTFAIMPLVIHGVCSLIKEGKYKLYIITLALAILFNFLIGIFVCIFVAIIFFAKCFIHKYNWRDLFKKLAVVAIHTGISVGMTAFLMIPTFFGIMNSSRETGSRPSAIRIYTSFADVFGNFIAFTPATTVEGLPNLYSGMISIMLLPLFILSKKIAFREKVAYSAIAAFVIVSTNVNMLDFVWNGLNRVNMIPFRFSFIASFLVIFMAYKAYLFLDEIKVRDIFAMGISASFFLLMATLGSQEGTYITQSIILAIVYLTLFAILIDIRKARGKNKSLFNRMLSPDAKNTRLRIFKCVFFIVIISELSLTAYNGVQRTSSWSNYPSRNEQVQELLAARRPMHPSDFFRTEFTRFRYTNDPSIYGYNGVTFFSSLANVNTNNFLSGLGLPGSPAANRYWYSETSPLTNAFLNIRYFITRDGVTADTGTFLEYVMSTDRYNATLFRNTRYLPFGFMVNNEMADFMGDRGNPFYAQNNLFRRATGIDEDLFTTLESISEGHQNYEVTNLRPGEYNFVQIEGFTEGIFVWYYKMPINGYLYIYCRVGNSQYIGVYVDGSRRWRSTTRQGRNPFLFNAGYFSQGEIVSVRVEATSARGTASIHVGFMDEQLFDQGFNLLSSETLTLIQFTDTRIKGNITVSEARLLYTSLPHNGLWRAFVNGSPVEIVTIGGAMAGVWLEPGEHIVEFRFRNRYFNIGVIISLLSLLIFLALILYDKVKSKGSISNFIFSIKQWLQSKREVIAYLFFGGATTLVSWVVYIIAVQPIGLSIGISNAIAWVAAVTFAFVTNKIWVFQSRKWTRTIVIKEAGLFLNSRIVTGVIEIIGVPLLVFVGLRQTIFGIDGFVARLIVSVLVIILNYVFSKVFVFKAQDPSV